MVQVKYLERLFEVPQVLDQELQVLKVELVGIQQVLIGIEVAEVGIVVEELKVVQKSYCLRLVESEEAGLFVDDAQDRIGYQK